ncbi:MAG: hypothetical protein ACYS9X_18610 [Planctomycetota bacterium]|jgi:hypothetical protein
MAENAPAHATDDASPSPFRRFPYGPALLCVACLAMAAWTWMRYSYAWEVKPSELGESYNYCYVRCTGYVSHRIASVEPPLGYELSAPIVLFDALPGWKGVELTGHHDLEVIALGDHGPPVTLNGRYIRPHGSYLFGGRLHVDEGRFHPASIAGLVVGAMGAFVCGLYLRRWLKERGGPPVGGA